MTFQEWAEQLDLLADVPNKPPAPEAKKAWRCDGPCGQLMYGIARIKNWNYPSSFHTPVGWNIDDTYERVCECCWSLHNTLADRSYWVGLRVRDNKTYKRLKNEGDYLA